MNRDPVVARITQPSPKPPGMGSVLIRNIDMLKRRRDQEEAAASFQDRLAAAITRFTGSVAFVYLHLVLFGFWIIVNLGLMSFIPNLTLLSWFWRWWPQWRPYFSRPSC